MSSSSSEEEEYEPPCLTAFPSEVHSKLEYRAYKSEIEERYVDRLASDENRNILEKILSLKPSRYARMWQRVMKETEEQSQKTKKPDKDLSEDYLKKVHAREYLDATIFPALLPAIEDTVRRAEENDCLKVQKCRFNGIDYIVEHLWNRNPKHPERASAWKTVFEIPFVREWLAKHPRPIYPKSWLWSREEATVVIQSGYRGYLVRRTPEVQEMRQFWKALAAEREAAQQKKEQAQREFLKIMQGGDDDDDDDDDEQEGSMYTTTDTSTEYQDETE